MESVFSKIGGYVKPFVTRNDMVHFSICDQCSRQHLISSGIIEKRAKNGRSETAQNLRDGTSSNMLRLKNH